MAAQKRGVSLPGDHLQPSPERAGEADSSSWKSGQRDSCCDNETVLAFCTGWALGRGSCKPGVPKMPLSVPISIYSSPCYPSSLSQVFPGRFQHPFLMRSSARWL